VSRIAIGVCAALERARWGPWEDAVTMLPRSYATAVQAAGGLAFLLAPDEAATEAPDPLLDRIDALILAGGSDVDPASYGAARHPETSGTCPERDRFEIALARQALERGMPVLGVCRGMEIANVALGGTLVQHLPDTIGSDQHRHTPGAFADHVVRLEPGSLAAMVSGAEPADDYVVTVKSHHHQGVDELGEGFVASGWSVSDGVIEAIELPGQRFALGVLWHPEEADDGRVIASLVEAATAGSEVGLK
jgi:putative glutamine amidotransferase